MTKETLPLEGIRVADFCWVVAGPYVTALMAALGAEVIKIEGHTRTDLMRHTVVWPLAEAAPHQVPVNQGMHFNSVNLNKKSVTLDLSKNEGKALARRLVATCDIVVDNMRAGSMARMGLGYDDLRQVRENIIVLSSSSRGQFGPQRDYAGYAPIHHAIGGGAYLTGYPDEEPCHSGSDTDYMNATTAAYAALTAIFHRMQTGEGQFIDYSQCEGVTALIGEQLLGYELNGRLPERIGNDHPHYAPHNVYRCWGADRWVALEAHSDEEFAAVAEVIGHPELASDARFVTMAARKQNQVELDGIIEAWTVKRDRDWVVAEFCRAGVAAAPSRDAADLYADPHLRERGAFVAVDHPELGELELVGFPWKMSGLEAPVRHAPLLGEDNDYVLGELLGLSAAELAGLRERDIIL